MMTCLDVPAVHRFVITLKEKAITCIGYNDGKKKEKRLCPKDGFPEHTVTGYIVKKKKKM